MNSIFLLLTLGSLAPAPARDVRFGVDEQVPRIANERFDESMLVMQQGGIEWPKVDPRNASKTGGKGTGKPSIGRAQLNEAVPTYDESTTRPSVKPTTPRAQTPSRDQQAKRDQPSRLVPVDDDASEQIDRAPIERAPQERQNKTSSRYNRDDDEDFPASKPLINEAPVRQQRERETEFTSTPLKTSVRRQGGSSRETAPSPFEIRTASATDDEDEPERRMPIKSYAVGADDRQDDFGVDPYSDSDPPRTGRRNNEYVSDRGSIRDTKLSGNELDESTLRGGKKVPETNANMMWGFAVVLVMLCASVGGNLYLAWVAREFYERYRSLAQQVRASRSNIT